MHKNVLKIIAFVILNQLLEGQVTEIIHCFANSITASLMSPHIKLQLGKDS